MKEKLLIGLDFGSDSIRAVLVNQNGKCLAASVSNYPRWNKKMYSDANENRFRQHPLDYIESMTEV
jgi:L-ribulokinase